jgi:hypothetical protein
MMGYDMGWASFNVVEVMSSSRFHLKSVGYLAAVQSFNQDTDVLMLTTNLLKKVKSYNAMITQPCIETSIVRSGSELYAERNCRYFERNFTYRYA